MSFIFIGFQFYSMSHIVCKTDFHGILTFVELEPIDSIVDDISYTGGDDSDSFIILLTSNK